MADLPPVTFPRLRILSLSSDQEVMEANGETVPTLPSSIFDGGMPNLTELKLWLVDVPWRSVRNLEILCLSSDPHSDLPPFALLLEMLRSCPRLRDLKLEWTIPPPNEQENYTVVELSHLTTLTLIERLARCTALLNHLRFPATAQLVVQSAGLATDTDLTDILIPLRQHVRSTTAPRAALLSLLCKPHASEEGNIANLITCLHSGTGVPHLFAPDNICMLMAHPRDDAELLAMLTSLSNAFPFDTLTHLDIRRAPRLQNAGFDLLLRVLPALEMLYLANDDGGIEFVLALCELERQDAAARAAYPRLQRLGVCPVLRDVGAENNSTIFPVLKLLLEARRANGTMLRALEVEEDDFFRLTEEEERILGSLVPLVVLGVSVRGVLYGVSTWNAELERRETERQRWSEQASRMFLDHAQNV